MQDIMENIEYVMLSKEQIQSKVRMSTVIF